MISGKKATPSHLVNGERLYAVGEGAVICPPSDPKVSQLSQFLSESLGAPKGWHASAHQAS